MKNSGPSMDGDVNSDAKNSSKNTDSGVLRTVVFANTIEVVEAIAKILTGAGRECFYYHSDSSREEPFGKEIPNLEASDSTVSGSECDRPEVSYSTPYIEFTKSPGYLMKHACVVVIYVSAVSTSKKPFLFTIWDDLADNEGAALLHHLHEYPVILAKRISVTEFRCGGHGFKPWKQSLAEMQDILNANDILDASVVSNVSTYILNADDILDASVVPSVSIDILDANDILYASVVSSMSIDILDADDILDASVVSSVSTNRLDADDILYTSVVSSVLIDIK
ncbi:hypothetical protein BC332_16271 [Capsicum chinense]|nr:hypothetical protein BC332_16271 [Capsicum chinense]